VLHSKKLFFRALDLGAFEITLFFLTPSSPDVVGHLNSSLHRLPPLHVLFSSPIASYQNVLPHIRTYTFRHIKMVFTRGSSTSPTVGITLCLHELQAPGASPVVPLSRVGALIGLRVRMQSLAALLCYALPNKDTSVGAQKM
jgi:hypothetical protein